MSYTENNRRRKEIGAGVTVYSTVGAVESASIATIPKEGDALAGTSNPAAYFARQRMDEVDATGKIKVYTTWIQYQPQVDVTGTAPTWPTSYTLQRRIGPRITSSTDDQFTLVYSGPTHTTLEAIVPREGTRYETGTPSITDHILVRRNIVYDDRQNTGRATISLTYKILSCEEWQRINLHKAIMLPFGRSYVKNGAESLTMQGRDDSGGTSQDIVWKITAGNPTQYKGQRAFRLHFYTDAPQTWISPFAPNSKVTDYASASNFPTWFKTYATADHPPILMAVGESRPMWSRIGGVWTKIYNADFMFVENVYPLQCASTAYELEVYEKLMADGVKTRPATRYVNAGKSLRVITKFPDTCTVTGTPNLNSTLTGSW